jgi:hypothetical protein
VFSRHGPTINAQAADLPSTATLAGGRFASVRGPHGALDVRRAVSGRCGGQRLLDGDIGNRPEAG